MYALGKVTNISKPRAAGASQESSCWWSQVNRHISFPCLSLCSFMCSAISTSPAFADFDFCTVLGRQLVANSLPDCFPHVPGKPARSLVSYLSWALQDYLVVRGDDDVDVGEMVVQHPAQGQVELVGATLLDWPVEPVAVVGTALLAPADIAPPA